MKNDNEEIIVDGVNVSGCEYCYKRDEVICCSDYITGLCEDYNCWFKQNKKAENELKEQKEYAEALCEEKENLNKIIDRLLISAGYPDTICGADDFELVYDNLKYKTNKYAELKTAINKIEEMTKGYDYWSASLQSATDLIHKIEDIVKEVKYE